MEYRRNPVSGKLYDISQRRNHMQEVYSKKSRIYKITKRFFDITLSCAALIVLSPLLAATSVAILLDDGGPVIFSQDRAGKDMKPFRIYKFRSMCRDADKQLSEMLKYNEQTGHAFKIKDDPRVTRVGRFIRRWSIDELPQLVNIIKGDMSIVGPRPILLFQMEESNDYERQRLTVQPGLTCYWQIGGRSDIKWDEWIELDLDYIEDMSFWTDLVMIIKTIPDVVRGGGAE